MEREKVERLVRLTTNTIQILPIINNQQEDRNNMPKSRTRKDHKKKVKDRNNRIKKEWEIASKKAWERYEEEKKKNESQNNESIRRPFEPQL